MKKKSLANQMEELEKKIQSNNKKDKYQLSKLYNESFKEKF